MKSGRAKDGRKSQQLHASTLFFSDVRAEAPSLCVPPFLKLTLFFSSIPIIRLVNLHCNDTLIQHLSLEPVSKLSSRFWYVELGKGGSSGCLIFSSPPFVSVTCICAHNFLPKPVSDRQLHYNEIILQITLNGTLWVISDLLVNIQIKIFYLWNARSW